jgi:hypothetical protein
MGKTRRGVWEMIKLMKIKFVLATLLLSSLFTSQVSAGSYTNSNTSVNSSLDRAKAKKYAEDYAQNPNFSYFDFTNYGGDCTNFISQVLFHGGLPEAKYYTAKDARLDPYSNKSWYYDGKDLPYRSTSWTGAHQFRYHWANVNGLGNNRAYQYKVYTMQEAYNNFSQIYYNLWPGDIVQYVNSSGDTWHSQVVHKYDSYGNLFVAQHTYNAKDLNLKDRIKARVDAGDTGWFVTYRIKLGTS